jgi:hypothetical protein
MAAWLVDPRLGAFAVRVLERLARRPESRDAAIAALARAESVAPSDAVRSDARDALRRLGAMTIAPMRRRPTGRIPTAPREGKPGVEGRDYWAMHTWNRSASHAPAQRAYIWAELRRGHFRQGWGWDEKQDLTVIQRQLARGEALNDEQKVAWRARRMLTTFEDGIRIDDIVVAVAIPEPDKLAITKVIGPYEFDLDPTIRDYGHLLPIRLLMEPIARHDPRISEALAHALRNRTRLWRIDGVGGDIEDLLDTR